MDLTEDLSARVLLKHILSTEPPRTPITRSVKKAESPSTTRRSSRLNNKDAVGQTPQDTLRRSLRQKMRESITRKSLPFTKRRTATQRESRTAAASTSLDSGDTPRHILRNILMTEPVRSPVVHKKTKTEEPQPSPANSSLTGKHISIELSGLDLPDVTVPIAPSFTRGLSRKRPRHSLNVTAFEKRLKGGDDVGEECEQSANEHSSLSFSSSTSLSLKTPFADVQTEKRGLQRRVSNRRKITEEEFGAAVNKIEIGGASSFVGLGPSDTAYSEGFTLGLSKLSKPDITTDIIHCDTTVDVQPDATACEEESRSRSQYTEREAAQDSQTEEGDGDPEPRVHVSARSGFVENEDETAEDSQTEEGDGDPEPRVHVSARSGFVEDEDETAEDSQTEEGDEDSQPEVDGSTKSQSQEDQETSQNAEEECGGDSQPKIDVSARPQPVEEEDETGHDSQTEAGDGDSQPEVEVFARSLFVKEEVETAQDSQTETADGDSQPELDVSARPQSAEEEDESARDSQTVNAQMKEVSAVDCHCDEEENVADDERDHQNSTEEDLPHSQAEDEELEEGGFGHQSEEQEHDEHLNYRDYCSGGGVTHATETVGVISEMGFSEGESLASELSATSQTERGHPENLADKENCSEGSRQLEAAAQDSAELEKEWEDEEEGEEVPRKTPAFVRERRVFSQPFIKNVQPSGTSKSSPAKSKQVRKKSRFAERERGLPKSYLMNVFKHFAKTKISLDVYPVLKETMNKFFERLVEDLETYAVHAKRKTIEVEDAELLLRRQGHVNDKVPVEVLIEKYLRLDQRKLLIPIATSGNVVIPKKR